MTGRMPISLNQVNISSYNITATAPLELRHHGPQALFRGPSQSCRFSNNWSQTFSFFQQWASMISNLPRSRLKWVPYFGAFLQGNKIQTKRTAPKASANHENRTRNYGELISEKKLIFQSLSYPHLVLKAPAVWFPCTNGPKSDLATDHKTKRCLKPVVSIHK